MGIMLISGFDGLQVRNTDSCRSSRVAQWMQMKSGDCGNANPVDVSLLGKCCIYEQSNIPQVVPQIKRHNLHTLSV